MAKNRYINTKFWSDGFIVELEPLERYLFLFLLTNEHTNIAGVYELPLRVMAFESGVEIEKLCKILKRFTGKIEYIDGWVCIKNFTKHQNTTSQKVVAGIEANLKDAPPIVIDKLISYGYPIDRQGNSIIYLNLTKLNSTKLNSTNNSEQSSPNKFDPKDLELATLLRDRIKENTPTFKEPNLNKWADYIRLMKEKDNRTYEQIEFVINWCQNNSFWKANVLSTDKLRHKFDTLVAQIKREVDIKKIEMVGFNDIL